MTDTHEVSDDERRIAATPGLAEKIDEIAARRRRPVSGVDKTVTAAT